MRGAGSAFPLRNCSLRWRRADRTSLARTSASVRCSLDLLRNDALSWHVTHRRSLHTPDRSSDTFTSLPKEAPSTTPTGAEQRGAVFAMWLCQEVGIGWREASEGRSAGVTRSA
jgi:hypothetical protein